MKFLILFSLALVGCTQQAATVLAPPTFTSSWPNSKFEAFAAKALDDFGAPLLEPSPQPSDMGTWCPLPKCPRKAFYINLLAQMAKYESSFAANATYTENFTGDGGEPQISEGLLSLSIDDGKNYGCGFKTHADVQDPEQNIRCGVRILAKWIPKDGMISGSHSCKGDDGKTITCWSGAARYWSPFRSLERLTAMMADSAGRFK